jgi:hypothetical protein
MEMDIKIFEKNSIKNIIYLIDRSIKNFKVYVILNIINISEKKLILGGTEIFNSINNLKLKKKRRDFI